MPSLDRLCRSGAGAAQASSRRSAIGLTSGLITGLALLQFSAPASAEAIGVLTNERGHTMTLFSEAGQCVRGARLAVWLESGGVTVPGCWIVGEFDGVAAVRIVFLDGDVYVLPRSAFAEPAKAQRQRSAMS